MKNCGILLPAQHNTREANMKQMSLYGYRDRQQEKGSITLPDGISLHCAHCGEECTDEENVVLILGSTEAVTSEGIEGLKAFYEPHIYCHCTDCGGEEVEFRIENK